MTADVVVSAVAKADAMRAEVVTTAVATKAIVNLPTVTRKIARPAEDRTAKAASVPKVVVTAEDVTVTAIVEGEIVIAIGMAEIARVRTRTPISLRANVSSSRFVRPRLRSRARASNQEISLLANSQAYRPSSTKIVSRTSEVRESILLHFRVRTALRTRADFLNGASTKKTG